MEIGDEKQAHSVSTVNDLLTLARFAPRRMAVWVRRERIYWRSLVYR
jgi:hypothetical protein